MIDNLALTKFEKIYADSYETISKYVICNCSNIEDVKDIIQNVYIEVFKHIEKIDETSYIIGIARNKIKDYYRFNYKKIFGFFEKNNDNLEELPSDTNIEENFLNNSNIEEIWNYLKSKPIIISKIFYLHYYLDLTIKEISLELKINESSVKNYLYRTLKELNTRLVEKSDMVVK